MTAKSPAANGDGVRLAYRPELDAIRGAAIALVLVQHFLFRGRGDERMVAAGALGVTLFFVLSGYLITSLLLAEQRESGRVDLRRFYARRIRRLFPALAVLVAIVAALGLSGNPLVALTYTSNLYIQAGGDMGYLGHTWTLAIEEQFYLVWPLALLVLVRWPRVLVGTLVVIAATSVVFRDVLGAAMKADGLALGAILAVWGGRLPRWAGIVGWLGIAAFVAVRGVPTWIYGAGAVTGALIVGSGLVPRWRWLIYLGTISYGVYLWHYPIARAIGSSVELLPQPFPAVAGLAGLILSITAAIVSERWVERRFRSGQRGSGGVAAGVQDREPHGLSGWDGRPRDEDAGGVLPNQPTLVLKQRNHVSQVSVAIE